MNWLDVLIVLPLLFGLVRGLMRGLVSEVIAIAVVVLGALGSRMWATQFSAWLLRQFAWPTEVCDVVAYILLFLAIAIVLSILAKLLHKFLRAIHLGWANRLLGGVFGLEIIDCGPACAWEDRDGYLIEDGDGYLLLI